MDQDFTTLMLSGERIFNLKHLIKLKRGLGSEADRLHEFFTNKKRIPSTSEGHVLQIKEMLKHYYHQRGWQSDSSITDVKRAELNI